MKTFTLFLTLVSLFSHSWSQTVTDPVIVNWMQNTTGDLYNGDSTDVLGVWYNPNNAYIKGHSLPSYLNGLTHSTINSPLAMNYLLRFKRAPVAASSPASVEGFIGVWLNGSIAASTGDEQYFDPMNQGLTEWARVAWYFEGLNFTGPNPTNSPWGDFDETYGHSTPNGEYHYHVYNTEMIADITDSSAHSGIIGYAFDGFPIYGPYGYANPNSASSSITRMQSGYQIRNMSNRNFLPDGSVSVLPPPINASYPLGCFKEDYEFIASSGDLDEHNGRFCVTPEYPNGTYAYFITLDDTLGPYYPYVIGPTFYGEKWWTGPMPSVTSLPGNAEAYSAPGNSGNNSLTLSPNPSNGRCNVTTTLKGSKEIRILDYNSQVVYTSSMTGLTVQLQLGFLNSGMYVVEVEKLSNGNTETGIWIKN